MTMQGVVPRNSLPHGDGACHPGPMPDLVDEFARNTARMHALIDSSLEASISVSDRHGWNQRPHSSTLRRWTRR